MGERREEEQSEIHSSSRRQHACAIVKSGSLMGASQLLDQQASVIEYAGFHCRDQK